MGSQPLSLPRFLLPSSSFLASLPPCLTPLSSLSPSPLSLVSLNRTQPGLSTTWRSAAAAPPLGGVPGAQESVGGGRQGRTRNLEL